MNHSQNCLLACNFAEVREAALTVFSKIFDKLREGSFLKFYFLRVPLHYSRILIPFFCMASDSVLV